MTYFCAKHAAVDPGRIALIDERGATNWQVLSENTNRLLHQLRADGIQTGDTIAVFAGNCREYFEILLAATHGGLLCVPVNWHFTADELAYVIKDSGAKIDE